MERDDTSWQDGLAANLLVVYREGLRKEIESVTVPVLAELAVTVSGETYRGEDDFYSVQIENLLREAIQQLEQTQHRRLGLEKLFGIASEETVLGLEQRRDDAAPLLGYVNKDSFRKAEPQGRLVEQVIRDGILRQMLALADEHEFVYTARHDRSKPSHRDADGADHEPSDRRLRRARSIEGANRARASRIGPRRRAIPALAIGVGLVAAAVALVSTGAFRSTHNRIEIWGPARPIYDYRRYDGNNNCANPTNPATDYGRCGAITSYPVFDSFIHLPFYGDERAFFDGRRDDQSRAENGDPIRNVTSSDKIVVLRIYVDNMAQVDEKEPTLTTAYNTRVRVALPTTVGKTLIAYAYISADRTIAVYDSAVLTSRQPFSLEYIPGSAILWTDGDHSFPVSDEIIGSEGALVGAHSANGELPPSDNSSTHRAR